MIITCPSCDTSYTVNADFPREGRKVRCAGCSEVWNATPVEEPQAQGFDDDQDVVFSDAEENAEPAAEENGDIDDFDFDPPAQDDQEDDEWAKAVNAQDDAPAGARFEDDDFDFDTQDIESAAVKPKRKVTVKRPKKASPVRMMQAFFIGLTLAGVLVAFTQKEDVVATFPSTARLYSAVGIDVNVRGLEFANLTFENVYEHGVPVLAVSGDIVNVAGQAVDVPLIRLSLSSDRSSEIYAWSIRPEEAKLKAGGTLPFTARLAAPPNGAQAISLRFTDEKQTRLGLLK